jgi:hypothetical protein
LGRRPLVAEQHWNFDHSQLARGLDAQMPVHYFAKLRASTEVLNHSRDRGARAIDDGVVLAGIASVENQAVNVPDLDFERRTGHAPSSPASDFSRQQSEWNKHQQAVLGTPGSEESRQGLPRALINRSGKGFVGFL